MFSHFVTLTWFTSQWRLSELIFETKTAKKQGRNRKVENRNCIFQRFSICICSMKNSNVIPSHSERSKFLCWSWLSFATFCEIIKYVTPTHWTGKKLNTFSMFANILGTVTFNARNDLCADNSLLGKVSPSISSKKIYLGYSALINKCWKYYKTTRVTQLQYHYYDMMTVPHEWQLPRITNCCPGIGPQGEGVPSILYDNALIFLFCF